MPLNEFVVDRAFFLFAAPNIRQQALSSAAEGCAILSYAPVITVNI
jgi:hypothetical protein